jgi:hypothetical protein
MVVKLNAALPVAVLAATASMSILHIREVFIANSKVLRAVLSEHYEGQRRLTCRCKRNQAWRRDRPGRLIRAAIILLY